MLSLIFILMVVFCVIPLVVLFLGFTVGFMITAGCLWIIPVAAVVLIIMAIFKKKR